jgi:hypothetical protein
MERKGVKEMTTMDWSQVLAIIGGNAAIFIPMFFWLRTEANADRRDILNVIREIQNEMKEFHGRLCAIEERNKK